MTDAAECRFLFLHLGSPRLGWQALAQVFDGAMQGLPGARVVGSFMGLFGIGSHELFTLVAGPAADDSLEARVRACLPADVRVVGALPLRATARPASDAPLAREGVFVFRFFDVRDGDVDEIVRLSRTAWETFEKPAGEAASGSAAYASEPVGLFRFADAAGPEARGRMLLLTWYDDLTSWERSRTPAPEATANFRRRAALTTDTIAYATRHVPEG